MDAREKLTGLMRAMTSTRTRRLAGGGMVLGIAGVIAAYSGPGV